MRIGIISTLGLISAALLLGCGIPQEKYDADMKALQDQITQAQDQLANANAELTSLKSEKGSLEAQLDQLQKDMERLSGESSANAKLAAAAKKRLDDFQKMLARFKSMVESGKLKIKIVNNKMVVEMASAILFPVGSADLSDEGKEALTQVAGILKDISDRAFQVAGHTDNMPIKNRHFKSNWELSTARAVSVVKHLIENGVSAGNLSAAGYAETQPAASNDTEDGKAQNRRIEIVLQPALDELPDLSSLNKMLDK
jgi:chemotaxis protein MotB